MIEFTEEEKSDKVYMRYINAFTSSDPKMNKTDLGVNGKPLGRDHFHLHAESDANFKNKWFPMEKTLHGDIKYMIEIEEKEEEFQIGVRFQQNNENNLVAFSMIKMLYKEIWDEQMKPGKASVKMDKAELRELQTSMKFIEKHIELLNAYVKNKYKNVVPEEKKKIKLLGPNDDVPKDLKV